MSESHHNGWKSWLIGAFFTIILMLGGFIVQANSHRLEVAEARLATLEAWAKGHEEFSKTRSGDLERRLTEIDRKLNLLLEERRRE